MARHSCSMQCLHTLYTVSESIFHTYIIHLKSVSISWCFQGLQFSLRLLKPCVVGNKCISFTKFNDHLTSLLSPSQSMWSKVSIQYISNHTVSVPYYDGVCRTFSIHFKNFLDYTIHFLHSVIFTLRCNTYTCTTKTLTGSASNLRTMILSLHIVFLTTHLIMLSYTAIAILLQLFRLRTNRV
jgi:hypothetical protein